MKVSNYLDTEPVQERPGVTVRDVISTEDGATRFVMRIFEVEPGASTNPHTHWWEHELFVLSGRGAVVGEQGETEIVKDSVIFIASDEHHYSVNKGNEPLCYILLNSLQQ